MDATSDFLFTYGTLMQGFDNPFAEQLKNSSIYYGKGFFPGLLYRISWYPGAIYCESENNLVYGEIYRLTDPAALLPVLDEYEDVFEDESSGLYIRRIVPVRLSETAILNCWTYLYSQPVQNLEVIESGDFRES